MAFAVVLIRGTINSKRDVRDTLSMLNIHKKHHCTVIPDTPSYRGMLQKIKDYATWGEVSPETLAKMMLSRGRLEGNVNLTEEYIKENTKYTSVLSLAKALAADDEMLKNIPSLKPVFRLSPPVGGFKKVKRPYNDRGDLGYRGRDINPLLERML